MRRADFDAVAATIRQETGGEWEAEPLEGLYGEGWIVRFNLTWKGDFIACVRCKNKTPDFVYETVMGIVRACYLFAVAETQMERVAA